MNLFSIAAFALSGGPAAQPGRWQANRDLARLRADFRTAAATGNQHLSWRAPSNRFRGSHVRMAAGFEEEEFDMPDPNEDDVDDTGASLGESGAGLSKFDEYLMKRWMSGDTPDSKTGLYDKAETVEKLKQQELQNQKYEDTWAGLSPESRRGRVAEVLQIADLDKAPIDELEYIKMHVQLMMMDAAAATLSELRGTNNLKSFGDQDNKEEIDDEE